MAGGCSCGAARCGRLTWRERKMKVSRGIWLLNRARLGSRAGGARAGSPAALGLTAPRLNRPPVLLVQGVTVWRLASVQSGC